ncbi:hypothetical protein KEM52_002728 [Ascosphaera acerosa]|nr:hypothetical protein KEM52_002728 [Ascosphaera acerosa]
MYTLSLPPGLFTAADADAGADARTLAALARAHKPAPFTFAHPHRILANNPYEVFVSLDNGTVLRMRRRAGDDGAHWALVTFDEKPWGASFRDLLRWKQADAVRYRGRALSPNTATAMAVSPDETFIFIVELNHRLKVWNLAGQQLVASRDLLGVEGPAEPDAGAVARTRTLNPADTALIRVFTVEEAAPGTATAPAAYYVVTYSPLEGGQFKFWAVRGGVTTSLTVDDMFPASALKPHDPDSSGSVFWTLADFQIKPTSTGRGMGLWVLWKNGNMHRTYSLHFDLETVEEAWRHNWTAVLPETPLATAAPPLAGDWSAQDPSEKWAAFLFESGRYTPEALATALLLYKEATAHGVASSSSSSSDAAQAGVSLDPSQPLRPQMVDAVARTVILRGETRGDGSGDGADNEVNFRKYRNDLCARWKQIWQIAEDLAKVQAEVLSLAYDTYVDSPWLALASGCAAVQECSAAELLLHNAAGAWAQLQQRPSEVLSLVASHRNLSAELGPRPPSVSALLHLGAELLNTLPAQLLDLARTALDVELFDDQSMAAADRVARFYELCQFETLVSDDQAADIQASIEKHLDLGKHARDAFLTALAVLPHKLPAITSDLRSTPFGRALAMRGLEERITLTRRLLESLLIIAVFMEVEMKSEADSFEGKWVFSTLVDKRFNKIVSIVNG